ncbi:hypothetical protein KO489_14805 [Reinekea forsetii]|nr:hypothetical protein [Reinekea forsetii]
MDYEWKCRVCEATNSKGQIFCSSCNSNSELSEIDIAERRIAFRDDRYFNDEEGIPPKPVTVQGRIQKVSNDIALGRNLFTRKLGNALWVAITLTVIARVGLLALYEIERFEKNLLGIGSYVLVNIFFAFEIKNFFAGKTTYLNGVRFPLPAKISYSLGRWVGLVFDFIFLYLVLPIPFS